MIRNDRQYRITKAQADDFEHALNSLAAETSTGVHPAIRQAQIEATRSQLEELQGQLAEYDALRAGKHRVLELTSLDELPHALISARIASGMTQKDLADRLGLKEQQIQRYEATNYGSASLTRIVEVVKALGLTIREDVFLPTTDTSFEALIKRLKSAGVDRELVAKLLPADALDALDDPDAESAQGIGLRLAAIVNRIFGWMPSVLFGDARPLAPVPALAVRFKVPANAEGRRTVVQAVYARYLASLVLEATKDVAQRTPSTDARLVRNEIVHASGQLSLHACLEYAWLHGIAVLPLKESGGFHGATWRIGGRNVVVLKQNTFSEARWMTDFLHELRHVAEEPDATEFEVVDTEVLSRERRESDEEQDATEFAGDVLLDGRAEDLAEACVAEANGKLEWLKTSVPRVAARENVRVDVLANYMAYRLALQGENWWGTATNLQTAGETPWRVARDFLVEKLDLTSLGNVDRQLLLRALEDD